MGIKGKYGPATERALKRVAEGSSVHGAAILEGISPSTLFRARKGLRDAAKAAKRKGKRK